jgi:hypothetical protein
VIVEELDDALLVFARVLAQPTRPGSTSSRVAR